MIIGTIVAGGFLIAAGLVFANQKSSRVSGPPIEENNVLTGDAKATTAAVLTKETGIVEYKVPDVDFFSPLEGDEVQVPPGTVIKTGDDGLAHVLFPDNSVMSLSQNSQVTVEFAEESVSIFQAIGNTWHRVESVIEGNSYTVETPSTLATVRGTEFNVGVIDEETSEVYVIESVVDVSKLVEDANGQIVIQETKPVEQDKHVEIDSSTTRAMAINPMPQSRKTTAWFQRNRDISERFAQSEDSASDKSDISNRDRRLDAIMHLKDQNLPKPDPKPIPESYRQRLQDMEKRPSLYERYKEDLSSPKNETDELNYRDNTRTEVRGTNIQALPTKSDLLEKTIDSLNTNQPKSDDGSRFQDQSTEDVKKNSTTDQQQIEQDKSGNDIQERQDLQKPLPVEEEKPPLRFDQDTNKFDGSRFDKNTKFQFSQ